MLDWMKNIFGKKASVQQSSRLIAETELTYMRSEHLTLGMYIAKLDCPWLDSPFKLQGFNVTTERELQVVRSRCHHVYVDRTRQSKLSLDAKTTAVGKAVVIGTAGKKKGSFETEIARATTTYLDTGRLVADFMQTVKDGGSIDSTQAKEAVASSVNSILHSPDAHLWLTQLKKKDEYTAQHSLNVCMLSIVLGRHIGLPESELRNLGICGMMHDMGIMLIPSAIVNKTSELTEEESVIMKTHTTLGAELLKSSTDMFHGAIETALTHHERIRGQGYPRGLTDAKVSYYSNIIAIVDTYDALTSDRSYRKGMTHLEATQVLYQQAGEYFDHVLVSKFIESLGVFPPGCYVQLSDDRVALVLEANDESKLRPRVLTVVDRQMNSIEEISVDLDKVLLDARGQPLQIQSIVNPDLFNIDRLKHFNESAIGRGLAMAAA